MKSLNKVTLLGRVERSPETSASSAGHFTARFSLGTQERRHYDGAWTTKTEWHNVVAHGRLAEFVREHVRPGSRLMLEGRLRTQSWTHKKCGDLHYRTEIIALEFFDVDAAQAPDRKTTAAEPADTLFAEEVAR